MLVLTLAVAARTKTLIKIFTNCCTAFHSKTKQNKTKTKTKTTLLIYNFVTKLKINKNKNKKNKKQKTKKICEHFCKCAKTLN